MERRPKEDDVRWMTQKLQKGTSAACPFVNCLVAITLCITSQLILHRFLTYFKLLNISLSTFNQDHGTHFNLPRELCLKRYISHLHHPQACCVGRYPFCNAQCLHGRSHALHVLPHRHHRRLRHQSWAKTQDSRRRWQHGKPAATAFPWKTDIPISAIRPRLHRITPNSPLRRRQGILQLHVSNRAASIATMPLAFRPITLPRVNLPSMPWSIHMASLHPRRGPPPVSSSRLNTKALDRKARVRSRRPSILRRLFCPAFDPEEAFTLTRHPLSMAGPSYPKAFVLQRSKPKMKRRNLNFSQSPSLWHRMFFSLDNRRRVTYTITQDVLPSLHVLLQPACSPV
ncbi:hypothetical protein BDP55DRAFT_676322 [Colletotrichum godetiae]|uniref:Uncharacterized protein n=1 Tax=Colletotrichum godetiae TaxID=1209918 RepID=A0AAJ0ACA3_9PEZI|nr:uncharacterized protein BDP55DRAFT_676322 [Colletotrichum godetiae]KAK1671283.1 hypothetical protein BDP55DRAFT_676322 [Colletotrichum godetiae]